MSHDINDFFASFYRRVAGSYTGEVSLVYRSKNDDILVKIPGFLEAWAYHTGDEVNNFWEIEMEMNRGHSFHFELPYTINMDFFESSLYYALESALSAP